MDSMEEQHKTEVVKAEDSRCMLGMGGGGGVKNPYPFELPVHMRLKLRWLEVAVFKIFKLVCWQ